MSKFFGILKCPFCNSRNVELVKHNDELPTLPKYYVQCNVCQARGSATFDEKNAVEWWNRIPRLYEDDEFVGVNL